MKKLAIIVAILLVCYGLYVMIKFSMSQDQNSNNLIGEVQIEWEVDISEFGKAKTKLDVLDIKFELMPQGKNVVRVKVKNTSGESQTFGIDIRVEGGLRNWQSHLFDVVRGKEIKWMSFDFEIHRPVTDGTSIRLQFYNPASVDKWNFKDWFKKIKYSCSSLENSEVVPKSTLPVPKIQVKAVTKVFGEFQSYLMGKKYEEAWELTSKGFQNSEYTGSFEAFKADMSNKASDISTLKLRPESATKSDGVIRLLATGIELYLFFVEEDGQWKFDCGQNASNVNTSVE